MTRVRQIMLIAAWGGLVWMLFARALGKGVSENIWVNVAYYAFLILIAVAANVAAIGAIGSIFRKLSNTWLIAFIVLLTIALAAAETFWLRDAIAQLLR